MCSKTFCKRWKNIYSVYFKYGTKSPKSRRTMISNAQKSEAEWASIRAVTERRISPTVASRSGDLGERQEVSLTSAVCLHFRQNGSHVADFVLASEARRQTAGLGAIQSAAAPGKLIKTLIRFGTFVKAGSESSETGSIFPHCQRRRFSVLPLESSFGCWEHRLEGSKQQLPRSTPRERRSLPIHSPL